MEDLSFNLFDDTFEEQIRAQVQKEAPPTKPVRGSKPKPFAKKNNNIVSYDVVHELDSSEDPVIAFAKKKGLDDMVILIRRWNAFVEAVNQSPFEKHLLRDVADEIHAITQFLSNTYAILGNKVDETLIADKSLLPKARKRKSEMLADIFNFYSDEYKEEE